MRTYLLAQIYALTEGPRDNPWAFNLVAVIWGQIALRYQGFSSYAPLFVMSVLWAGRFVLGSLCALRNSWRVYEGTATAGEAADRWSAWKTAAGVGRFAAWVVVYLMTFVIRQQSDVGSYVAAMIELATWLAEGSGALKSYGVYAGAKWAVAFAGVADAAEARLAAAAKHNLDDFLPEQILPNGTGKE